MPVIWASPVLWLRQMQAKLLNFGKIELRKDLKLAILHDIKELSGNMKYFQLNFFGREASE
jgi:hypothetical protein